MLKAFVIADSRKRQIDLAVEREGLIVGGATHPGLRISNDLAGLMASLASKLRLCQSSRTRPDAASLKEAHVGLRPWDDQEDKASKYFD